MEISYEDINPALRHIKLAGRLDIRGTDLIAARFAELSTDVKRNVIVDFTGVTFLASIGIRALISNAKALHKLGGRMALVVGDNTSVAKTLSSTGIDVLLQMFTNLEDAEKSLNSIAA
jgi:anti-sigma B factor antagonist